jgi:hypothetical protein
MGTPHSGSDMANVGDVAAKIAKVMLPNAFFRHNRDLISSLRKDSTSLFQTARNFTKICMSMKIYSFFELLTQRGSRVVRLAHPQLFYISAAIEERSAVVNLPNETPALLNANHRNMSKFRDNDDQNFAVVRSSICELMKLTLPPRSKAAPKQNDER